MRIILDVMGGDNPVEEFVKGAVMARNKFNEKITFVFIFCNTILILS